MQYTLSELEHIDFSQIPWDLFVHYNGRADDLPPLFDQAIGAQVRESRYALFSIANNIEHEGGLIIATPITLIRLFQLLEQTPHNQDMLLRIILKVAKAIGYQWERLRDLKDFASLPPLAQVYAQDSPYLWPEFIDREQDAVRWASTDMQRLFDISWFYSKEVLCCHYDQIKNIPARDEIEQGMIYDLETIIKMILPQDRAILDLNQSWHSERLTFKVIQDSNLDDLLHHLTPAITKYLSFDANNNRPLLKEYIRRSRIEVKNGTALVLVVLDKQTNAFLGSCGLSDINAESAEIGLWLKESEQGKGYGTEIVQMLLSISKNSLHTKSILYAVEKGNVASEILPTKFGFTPTYDFIIEPTQLKNRLREMKLFTLLLS